jgi:hypothetical protein
MIERDPWLIRLKKPIIVFFFNVDDEAKALRLARQIAAKNGRLITVKKPDGSEIEAAFPTRH